MFALGPAGFESSGFLASSEYMRRPRRDDDAMGDDAANAGRATLRAMSGASMALDARRSDVRRDIVVLEWVGSELQEFEMSEWSRSESSK